MHITDKLVKPVTEMKYLNADNVSRYRCIMRIFFENYEKLRYWLYQEDVYEEMIREPMWADYKPEQCQQDLTMLTEWKNLSTMQDTRKVSSIEEFKNKKYRYQMSEYSVEIERLVIRLENLFVEGASLEPTLLERIRLAIEKFPEMAMKDRNDVYTWWNDMNNDFVNLNQNYQDYIRDLNSVKAEEMMHTREFLIFKDRLIEYLRNFVKGLQHNVGAIEENLRLLEDEKKEAVFRKIVEYQMLIPRLDTDVTEKDIEENVRGRFQSIFSWFVGSDGQENEAGKLFDATNEIIRRMTRYAAQLSEKNSVGANRKEEYRKVAEIFMRCETLNEAHKMSAMVFGIEKPYHLSGDTTRETESMNKGVYNEPPVCVELKPRVRTFREKSKRSSITESSEQKRALREELLKKQSEDMAKVRALEDDGIIDFSNLPVLEPGTREILLKWISNAMESSGLTARTDEGRTYILDIGNKMEIESADGIGSEIESAAGMENKNEIKSTAEKCVVRCEDGNFTMPKMRIIFQEDTK